MDAVYRRALSRGRLEKRHTDVWLNFYYVPQILAALDAEREAKELYQSKLEESLRSDDTDDEISDIPTKIIGSPHRVDFFGISILPRKSLFLFQILRFKGLRPRSTMIHLPAYFCYEKGKKFSCQYVSVEQPALVECCPRVGSRARTEHPSVGYRPGGTA